MTDTAIKSCVDTLRSYCANGDTSLFDVESAERMCELWVANGDPQASTGKEIVFEQFRRWGKQFICESVRYPQIKIWKNNPSPMVDYLVVGGLVLLTFVGAIWALGATTVSSGFFVDRGPVI